MRTGELKMTIEYADGITTVTELGRWLDLLAARGFTEEGTSCLNYPFCSIMAVDENGDEVGSWYPVWSKEHDDDYFPIFWEGVLATSPEAWAKKQTEVLPLSKSAK